MTLKSSADIRSWLTETVARHARMAKTAIDPTLPFYALGIDSIARLTIVEEMSEWLGWKLPDLALEEHTTIDRLVAYLAADDGIA